MAHASQPDIDLTTTAAHPAPTTPGGGLKVGLVAPPWVPVPPPGYGGTELVIDVLARGLQRAGCDVRLVASGDSTCPVPRVATCPEALGTTADRQVERLHVEAAYEALAGADVVHDHTIFGPALVAAHGAPFPVVTTAHGVFRLADVRRHLGFGDDLRWVAISWDQARRARPAWPAAVIHHGIDVDRVPVGTGDGGYVVFLGRMSPDKGAHRAILAARAAGRRIVLAAKMWEPDERRYFEAQVRPLLGADATYVGSVGGAEKHALLGGAAALLNPITWPEPFGLVMVEALAAGTPVLAFPAGAAPEIVRHGVNGALCVDVADMARQLRRVERIDRATCRRDAEARFGADRMVADHLALYADVLAAHRTGRRPAPAAPRPAAR